jgi:hypothetical protein
MWSGSASAYRKFSKKQPPPLLKLVIDFPATSAVACSRPRPKKVISTEATDSLIVGRAVGRPPHFAFVVALAFLIVIPKGDLLFAIAIAVVCSHSQPKRRRPGDPSPGPSDSS